MTDPIEEARAAKDVLKGRWPQSLLTRLADRVEELESLLQGVGVPKLDHIHAQRQRWPHLHRPEGLHDHSATHPTKLETKEER